jgi:hypothetical protein
MTQEHEAIIANYYKKIGTNNNHIQNAELLSKDILSKYTTAKYEQTEFNISIWFKIYERGQLNFDELLSLSAKEEDWRGAFMRQVFTDVNRVKKTLPLLNPSMREIADRHFIRYHMEDKKLFPLWRDEAYLERYLSSYFINAKEYHPFAQMRATFEILNVIEGTRKEIIILSFNFDERIFFHERYAKNLISELDSIDFYNTLKEMDLSKKIKYLDFFENIENIKMLIDGPHLEQLLKSLPVEKIKSYPRLTSHAKGETSEIELGLSIDERERLNKILKNKLTPSQNEINKLETKYREVSKKMPSEIDTRYGPRPTDEEEKLKQQIAQEQIKLRQEIFKLENEQVQIKDQFKLEEKENIFAFHFPDIQDKIVSDLPITKNRILLLNTSGLELAYAANQTTSEKILSFKDLFQIIKRSDPSLHLDIITKFCFNQTKVPTRSKLYTCLQAINLVYEKNPLTFDAATTIDQDYMRYIAADEFEGYFDFRQTEKTVKELEIEEEYIKIYENFANNHPDLSMRTFGNTKGVILNLGLTGKCLASLRYFMRRS